MATLRVLMKERDERKAAQSEPLPETAGVSLSVLRQEREARRAKRLAPPPETTEDSLLDKVIDSVPTDLLFAPSFFKKAARIPRKFEALEDAGLRAITGLDIDAELRQEIKRPLATSPLDFISTQGRIKGTVDELLPEVRMPTEAEHVLAPGRTIVLSQLDMLREGVTEVADFIGFALRPDQMFGMMPLMTGIFKLSGGSIKKLVGIIKNAGIKEGESLASVTEKIAKQTIKETGVKEGELNRYLGEFHDFGSKLGTGIEYESEGAKKVAAMFERAEALSAEQKAFSPKRLVKSLKRMVVDVAGNIKSALAKEGIAGKEVIMKHDLIAGAPSEALLNYNNVANDVYGKLSRNDIRQLNRMISSRNEISISRFRTNTRAGLKGKLGEVEAKIEDQLLKQKTSVSLKKQIRKLRDEKGEIERKINNSKRLQKQVSSIEEKIDGLSKETTVAAKNQVIRLKAERIRIKRQIVPLGDLQKKLRIIESRIKDQLLKDESNVTFGAFESEIKKLKAERFRLGNAIKEAKDTIKPEGRTAEDFINFMTETPPELNSKLQERANMYFREMRNQLTKLHNEGLLTDDLFETLLEKGDYSPREILKFVDPDRVGFNSQGGRITVPDSGLKKLAEGTEALMETDSSLLLSQVMSRTQGRLARNRANQALHRLAEINPENGIVFLEKPKIPNKSFEPVSVMIEGKQVEMFMPSEFAREWLVRDPEISTVLANILGWGLGSKVLKPFATGLNPAFAFSNIFRDIAHAWLTTKEFSPILPKAIGQIGRNMGSVFNDAIFRKGLYLDYANTGGGMEFMTLQGRVVNPMSGVFGKLQSYLAYTGETSEILGRLMLTQQGLRNGKSMEEAVWIARNYLDFSQGGSVAKAVDNAVPYLNAGIQGTRGVIRAGITDPKEFLFKVSQIGTLATGLYLANKHQNPEAWAQISDRDKVGNWIITTPFSFTNTDGDKSYIYFKFAKDQGQRLFATAFENGMARFMGEEVNGVQVAQSITDAIPASITSLPPTISAVLGYWSNKDFWLNKDIWGGHQEIEAGEEYYPSEQPFFVSIGKATGLSPARTKTALSKFFTRGHVLTSVVGAGWNSLFDNMPEDFREKTTIETILSQPIIRRMVSFTRPVTEFREEFKEIRKEEATENFVRNREFNRLVTGVLSGKLEKKELNAFILTHPLEVRDQLNTKFQQMKALEKIPNKKLWLEIIRTQNTKARARQFFLVFNKSSEEKQKELSKSLRRIGDINTEVFQNELRKLKRESKK